MSYIHFLRQDVKRGDYVFSWLPFAHSKQKWRLMLYLNGFFHHKRGRQNPVKLRKHFFAVVLASMLALQACGAARIEAEADPPPEEEDPGTEQQDPEEEDTSNNDSPAPDEQEKDDPVNAAPDSEEVNVNQGNDPPDEAPNNDNATDEPSGHDDAASPADAQEPARTPSPALAEECVNLALASSAVDIGGGLPAGYEPSGADWHSRLNKVFSVHDNGYLFMMNKDGSEIATWAIGGDLEGVTIADPESDFVYIGREYPAAILEFNIESGVVTRTFSLGGDMPESSSQGLEALTFVERVGHPEGGEFWAGHQGSGRIYVFDVPIVSSTESTAVTLTAIHQPVVRSDLSGMDYSPFYHVVYVIYDSSNRLVIVDPDDASVYLDRDLAQSDQEGIAVNELCDLFIAQDTNKRFWFYQGREEDLVINQQVVRLLADRVMQVQNNDGSYDWKQIVDDPLTPETTGYQNVTGVSVWGLFNATRLLEDESYLRAIENSVNYFDSRIDSLLTDPHDVSGKLSCPNYAVLSWYLQESPNPILTDRVIAALDATLDARDSDYGDNEAMRVDGMFNYMITRRASIPGIIPWDMGLCIEAFGTMADISSDFEADYRDSLSVLANYLNNDFLPAYDADNTILYGDISLSMPLFVLAGSPVADSYTDLIAELTVRLENLIDEEGLITNGSENGDGLEQPSAYGLMALKQIGSRYTQLVQNYLESSVDGEGRLYDPNTREETYEVEGEVLRAIAMERN